MYVCAYEIMLVWLGTLKWTTLPSSSRRRTLSHGLCSIQRVMFTLLFLELGYMWDSCDAGGDGRNPWEAACSTSTPASEAFGGLSPPPSPFTLGNFTSSNPALNSVWQFCAYTIIATSLDVNVDGQTRERDVDVVDALNTALGQFYVFSPNDDSIQTRTFLEMMTNDTGMWSQWYDFKASTVLTAAAQALYASNGVNLASTLWSDNDDSILSDSDASYNSLQFLAGLRYWNGSGRGLLSFPANGSCLGSWSCNGLVDWPTGTRDGYDVGRDNSDDTVRNALGIMAYNALGDIALWLGHNEASVRYKAMAATASEALLSLNLRHNGSEAYFVDGAVGSSADHAAVHSTLYSISAGVADAGGEPLAKVSYEAYYLSCAFVARMATILQALTAYLARHGVAPSSCMMGRWWVDGLYNLGVYSADAADLALTVLTTDEYPSWRNMMAQVGRCHTVASVHVRECGYHALCARCRALQPRWRPGALRTRRILTGLTLGALPRHSQSPLHCLE